MGTRGPVPKRDDERKRTNERPMETTRAVGAAEVKQPRGDGDWHPIVKKLWKAMGESGQSQFYEPSDWAIAYSTMDDLSDTSGRRGARPRCCRSSCRTCPTCW